VENLDKIKRQGFRLTKPRQLLLKTLTYHPLTIQEIATLLHKKKSSVDLVSIYRSLELFIQIGIVNAVEFGDGKKRYELNNPFHHHHHLICRKCGTVKDIELDEKILLTQIKKKTKFKIVQHQLEFFGLCPHCQ